MSHPLPAIPPLQPPRLHLPEFRDEVPAVAELEPTEPKPEEAKPFRHPKPQREAHGGRVTINLDDEMGNRLRNAGHAIGQSVARFCAFAVASQLGALEQTHGGPFPQRPSLRERILAARPTPMPEVDRSLEPETA